MPPYQYSPLDPDTEEIRLIELHAGAFDDGIQVSMRVERLVVAAPVTPFDDRLEKMKGTLPQGWWAYETVQGRIIFLNEDNMRTSWTHPDPYYKGQPYEADATALDEVEPVFEALSYTWGSEAVQLPIEVISSSEHIGQEAPEEETFLLVRSNLHDALKHLRHPTSSRAIWIDAISINQGDALEKSQQVRRMADIFRSARRVVVWLGLATDSSSWALRLLERLGDQIQCTKAYHRMPSPNCPHPDWYLLSDAAQIESDPRIWDAVFRLLWHPWFYRLWIRQEIALANASAIMQCGQHTILWRHLRSAILHLDATTFPSDSPFTLYGIGFRSSCLALLSVGQDPLTVLRDAMYSCYTSQRDIVFAILGLLPPVLSGKIQPQYLASNRKVFQDAVLAFITCTGSLDVLNFSHLSWIPDWSDPRSSLGWIGLRCSGQSTADCSHVAPGTLATSGVTFDTVVAVSDTLPDDADVALSAIQEVWTESPSDDHTYPNGNSLPAACAWVLTGGEVNDYWRMHTDYPTLADAQVAFLRPLQDQYANLDPQLHESISVTGSVIFKTAKGYFGKTYSTVMPGDTLAVLLGSSMPTILRKQRDDQHLYVGCAYVHGIMAAEALLGPLPCGWKAVARHDGRYGDYQQCFVDPADPSSPAEDPRLGGLPGEWTRTVAPDRLWAGKKVDAFRNTATGQILYSDPRMLPDALKARGVPLETFKLI